MATPIPKAKPISSGTGGIVAILLLLALLGGEYYFLTLRDAKLHPDPALVAQLARVKAAEKAAQKSAAAAEAKAKKGKKGKQARLSEAAKSSPPAPAPGAYKPPGTPIDLSSMFGQSTPGGPGMMEQAMAKVTEYENLGAGVGIRFFVVLACVALLFIQKPPVPKVGAQRRIARNPKTIVVPMQMIAVLLFFSAIGLLGVGSATGNVLTYGYPLAAALCLGCGFIGGQLRASTVPVEGKLMAEKIRRDTDYGIVLTAEANRYVNVPNPFRGTLVLGGAGAGKTYSIGEPFLEQFLQKGMCGIIYDFKFPVLAAAAQKAMLYAQPAHQKLLEQYAEGLKNGNRNAPGLRKAIRHRVVNFLDMERSEKVNPLRPQDMPVPAYAMEYAATILTNLSSGGIKGGDDFFVKSARAYLTGIIWYYRNNYPALCTIPHVVATAVYKDFTHVLHMLSLDPSCQVLVQSLITAVQQGAEKQIAGIISSLQVDLSTLATPEISWVLSPDEDPALGEEAEGFSLNLNDPSNPTLLTIGNDPTLAKTFSPVISCIIAVALKLMNQQYKHPSFVLIDEGATIYVPGLETIPATARSNKVAMLYMTQDMAQLIDAYGKDKAQVLVSNLNNQFFGKINSAETARLVSDMVGKEDVEMISVSSGQSQGGSGGSNKGQSVSVQERQVFRMQDAYTLRQGEFVGQTVETPNSFFMAQMERDVEPGNYPIEVITHFAASKGVVSAPIRKKVESERLRVSRMKAEQLTQRIANEDSEAAVLAALAQQERAALVAEMKLAPAGRKKNLQAYQTTQTGNTESSTQTGGVTQSTQTTQTSQIEDEFDVFGEAQTTQTETEAPAWNWDDEENPEAQPPSWQPSPAEQLLLKQSAALSRHNRGRTEHVPDAANNENWQSEAQRQEEEEKRANARAEERAVQRTTQVTERPSKSVMAEMIANNYTRIRDEVAKAILNSGFNWLSKDGLAKAAQEAKTKASAVSTDEDY